MAASKGQAPKNVPVPSLPRICKLKKGDSVKIISGSLGGRNGPIGKLTKIDKRKRQVLIDGVHKVTVHRKKDPSKPDKPSGRFQIEAPVHVSNVALMCPHCVKPTRVLWKFLEERQENGKVRKVRICRRCGERIDNN
jgi:large subunit ribosomal protein L24